MTALSRRDFRVFYSWGFQIYWFEEDGVRNAKKDELVFQRTIMPKMMARRQWGAIQVSTASGLCAVLDIVLSQSEHYKGLLRQQDFTLSTVLENQFGKALAQ